MTKGGWNRLDTPVEMGYKATWNSPWFVIREFMQNSCPYDMPLLILKDGKIQLVDIGKFVEDRLEDDRQGTCKDSVYALSFHLPYFQKSLLTWQKIEKVYRHPYQGDMVKVAFTNGLGARVTTGHSLFKRTLAHGKVSTRSLPTSNLLPSDYVAIPFTNLQVASADEFDVLECLQDKSGIVVRNEAEHLIGAGLPISKDARHLDSVPLSVIRQYNVPLSKYCLIDLRWGKNPIPRTLPMEPLVFLMGLYLAEGSIMRHKETASKMICLSLGRHETALLQRVEDNARRLGVPISVTHPHETAVNVLLSSWVLACLFEQLFGKVRANGKYIPDMVFNLSLDYRRLFLDGYVAGDGYSNKEQDRVIAATASVKLNRGLQYLLLLSRTPFRVETKPPEDRMVKGKLAHFGESYRFYVRNSGGDWRNKQEYGDLSFVGVKKVEPIEYDRQWVYDIGVPGFENFVGGDSPLMVHNSMDEHDQSGVSEMPMLRRIRGGVEIEDSGGGVGASSLLLREVKGGKGLRGQFGEGLKWACLAALRLGYDVRIESEKTEIVPFVKEMDFDEEPVRLLCFKWRKKEGNGERVGTTVTVKGYDGLLYEDRFFQWFRGGKRWTSGKDCVVCRAEGLENRLYVKDIYVRELGDKVRSRFTYNLWNVDVDPDRLQVKSSWDLGYEVSKLWLGCKDVDMVGELLQAVAAGEWEKEIAWSGWPTPDIEVWQEAWNKVFGQRVLGTDDFYRELVQHDGFDLVEMPESFRGVLKRAEVRTDKGTAKDYDKEFQDTTVIVEEETLSAVRRNNLGCLKMLGVELQERPWEQVSGRVQVLAARIPPLADGRAVEGVMKGNDLYLNVDALDDFWEALRLWAHELGHLAADGDLGNSWRHTETILVNVTRHLHSRAGAVASVVWKEVR